MVDVDETFERAGALFDEGQYEEAFLVYGELVAADPTRARAIGAQSRCLSALERHEDAIALARHAVAVDEMQPYAHVALVIALHGAKSRASELIAAVAEAEGVALSPIQSASLQAMLAYAHIDLDQIDQAYGAALKSVELAPDTAMAHCAVASALGLQNRMGPALAAIERAIELDPEDDFYIERRETLRKGVAILEDSLKEATERVVASPSADTWTDLGGVLALLGRYRDAVDAFDHAIKIDPDSPHAWNGKGWALHHEGGNFPEDVLAFQKAGELADGGSKRTKPTAKAKAKAKAKSAAKTATKKQTATKSKTAAKAKTATKSKTTAKAKAKAKVVTKAKTATKAKAKTAKAKAATKAKTATKSKAATKAKSTAKAKIAAKAKRR